MTTYAQTTIHSKIAKYFNFNLGYKRPMVTLLAKL